MTNKPHWWSGWPGAFCLFCGAPDNAEQCLGDGCAGWCICAVCGEHRPNPVCDSDDAPHQGLRECPQHPPTPCPVQGHTRLKRAQRLHLPEDV